MDRFRETTQARGPSIRQRGGRQRRSENQRGVSNQRRSENQRGVFSQRGISNQRGVNNQCGILNQRGRASQAEESHRRQGSSRYCHQDQARVEE